MAQDPDDKICGTCGNPGSACDCPRCGECGETEADCECDD